MARAGCLSLLGTGFCLSRRSPRPPKSSPSDRTSEASSSSSPHGQEPRPRNDTAPAAEPFSFHDEAKRIAQIPAGGIRRTTAGNMSYITSYESTPRPTPARLPPPTGTIASTDATLVGDAADVDKNGAPAHPGPAKESAWERKPKGSAYDRREELTEEDEDTWARLAM